MKTQSFGWSPSTWCFHLRASGRRSGLAPIARQNYIERRSNGDRSDDSPRSLFPADGTYSDWIEAPLPGDRKGYYRIRYDEGPKDRKWMQEMDRNYIFRLVCTAQWNEFDRMKNTGWPDHLNRFAGKLEANYRIIPTQLEAHKNGSRKAKQAAERLSEEQKKWGARQAALERQRAFAEQCCTDVGCRHFTLKHSAHKVKARAQQQSASTVMPQAKGIYDDVLELLDAYLIEYPRSVEALKLRAHALERLASHAHSEAQKRRLLKAAATDFNTLLDIDVADTEASDGLDRVNALLNPPTSTPTPKPITNPVTAIFERLGRIWKGKYGEPLYVPVGAKLDGSAIGAIYLKEKTKPGATGTRRRWLGRTGGRAFSTRSLLQRGAPMNPVRELIAAHAYDLLANNSYIVPKNRLAKLPLINRFTETHLVAQELLTSMNRGRPEAVTETVHLMSKWIENYANLGTAQVYYEGTCIPMMTYIEIHRQIPTNIVVDGREIPLVGVIEILAASRLLGDTDVFGREGKNTGFIIERDLVGVPIQAKAVKINAGSAFNFQGVDNRLSQSFHTSAPSSTRLADRRDIQFGNRQTYDIEWVSLSYDQRITFMRAFKDGLELLSTPLLLRTLIDRSGAFNRVEAGLLLPEHVDELEDIWENDLRIQERDDVYGVELAMLDMVRGPRS